MAKHAVAAIVAKARAVQGNRLRCMYRGGRGNATARRFARVWAWAFSKGIVPGRRWVTLEVPGRRTGRPTRFPLGIAVVDGQQCLDSMLGNDCNWVRNVRANHGDAILDRRHRRRVHLVEIPTEDRPPLLKAYLQQVPGARPHIPVDPSRPVADFLPVAADYPIFRITSRPDTKRP